MLDLTKPVQTRGGRTVRILATNVRNRQPVAAIVIGDWLETVETYCLNGQYLDSNESDWDLVNVITPHAVLKQEFVESLSGRDEPSEELINMRAAQGARE